MSVRNALLGLLAQRPRHGYELHAAFEAVVGGEQNWDVKPAQVYTTLARLQESGLVSEAGVGQEGGPEKRTFTVTEAGRMELANWFAAGVDRGHLRDEFFLKLMLSLATGLVSPQRIIQKQRATLYRELHTVTAQRNQANPRLELAQILLLDKVIMHLEADLRWLDMIEGRLEEIKRQPLPEPEVRTRGRPPKAIERG
ncbi:MAG: PadR family transcriptional regulator [Chloroflexota bacterium]